MTGAAMVVIVESSRSMMSATRTMPRTSHAAAGSLDASPAGLEDTCTVIGNLLWRAGLYVSFRVPGLFCGGGGLPGEVAVGEGAACGQGEGGDGQGDGVAEVEGASGGVQRGGGLAGGGGGLFDAAGGAGGGGCGEADRAGVDGGEDGSQDGDAGEAA